MVYSNFTFYSALHFTQSTLLGLTPACRYPRSSSNWGGGGGGVTPKVRSIFTED